MLDIFSVPTRALIFILAAFGTASAYNLLFIGRYRFLVKWLAVWTAVTSVAFLSNNIWLLILTVWACCRYVLPAADNQKIPYYFAILPVLPNFLYQIPGVVPGINYLFEITYPRMLALFIFLPIFVRYIVQSYTRKSRLITDKIDLVVLLYVFLLSILSFRNPSLTSALRAIFYLFLDIVIPYVAISRCVKSPNEFKYIFVAMVFSAIVVSIIGIFEEYFRWWFYAYLPNLLGFVPLELQDRVIYVRGGLMRIRSTMETIPLGYFLALALGALLYLKDVYLKSLIGFLVAAFVMGLAMLFTDSRGAGVAALIVFIVYFFRKVANTKVKLIIISLVVVASISLNFAINKLHLYDVDKYGTFQYRVELVENSISVIMAHPLAGEKSPEQSHRLDDMRQGQGIIDIVNAYVEVALYFGLIGLVLFVSIFFILLKKLFTTTRWKLSKAEPNVRLLGNVLFAMIIATMVMIGTVSSINYIPIYYWSLIGLAKAYLTMIDNRVARVAENGVSP